MMAPTQAHTAGETLLPLVDLNLERREERRSVLRRSRRHVAAIVAAFALAVTVPLPLTLQAFKLRHEYQNAERQAAGVRQRLQSVTTISGEMDAKISLWTRLAQSQQNRHAWEAALPSLAACLPVDVSVQQVEIAQKNKDTQVQLQGSAETMAGLRTFTTALTRSPLFANLRLNETTSVPSGVNFQMTGSLSGAAASGTEPGAP